MLAKGDITQRRIWKISINDSIRESACCGLGVHITVKGPDSLLVAPGSARLWTSVKPGDLASKE